MTALENSESGSSYMSSSLTYTDNIGVEILVLSPLDLIWNIALLTAEAVTVEPNDEDPTFNKEPSPDNDEVKNIFISDFCSFT